MGTIVPFTSYFLGIIVIISKEKGDGKMKNIRKWLLLLLLAFTLMGKDDDEFEPNLPIGDEGYQMLSVEHWN